MPSIPALPSIRTLPALMLLLALLAGCAGNVPAQNTPTPRATVARIIPPTYTPAPTATPEPAFTPTGQPEPADALTPAPARDPALDEVKLVGLSWLEKYKYNLLLSFDFPGPVDPADYRVTLEGKEYYCETIAQYPNRLYCNGQGAKVLATALVQIFPAGSDAAGFEQEVWVPYFN